MSPQSAANVTELLEQSRQEFTEAVAGVSDAQAAVKPDAARWSVLECVEHVVLAEERFLKFLDEAARLDAPQVSQQKQAELSSRIRDRSQRAQAPPPVQPTGRYATLAQAMEAFQAVRTRSVHFAQERAGDLDVLNAPHPRFGPVSGREWILIIDGHARRHAAQIREIRAAL